MFAAYLTFTGQLKRTGRNSMCVANPKVILGIVKVLVRRIVEPPALLR